MRSWAVALALCVAVLASMGCDEATSDGGTRVSARAIEARLHAPCCLTQPLDGHESELASSLRAEIAQRVERGESGDAIEDNLAARYGERIRAVPRGRDSRSTIPIVVGAAMLASLFGLVMLIRRWTKRGADASVVSNADASAERRDAYDDRLEDELAQLDDR